MLLFLVGDNPFHSISHLSQERARARGDRAASSEFAASLVMTSLENGANGFMFSVSETTLSILKEIRRKGEIGHLGLYAIVPYAYEYVRLAIQARGMQGLAKRFVRQILESGNLKAVGMGLKGILRTDPAPLMRAYLSYEVSRVKKASGKRANLSSVLIHQMITDLALALDLDWFFRDYMDFMSKLDILPGFNTGNFAHLVGKFGKWKLGLRDMLIAAPFNSVGFQMIPSKDECENALKKMPSPNVVAISILAAGYIKPQNAVDYIASLPNIKGAAVGVSKEKHARETFRILREKLTY